jgi:hypothetical protein
LESIDRYIPIPIVVRIWHFTVHCTRIDRNQVTLVSDYERVGCWPAPLEAPVGVADHAGACRSLRVAASDLERDGRETEGAGELESSRAVY